MALLAAMGRFGTVILADDGQPRYKAPPGTGPAIDWLLAQVVPNETVPLPAPNRRHLILSYRVPPDHSTYRYISGRSYIYDDALAVIALTMAHRYQQAESILLALDRLTEDDGTLWFGYNTQNTWPSPEDHDGAIRRVGATAWVGYAVVYYLQRRMAGDERFLSEDPLASRFLQMATRIADRMMRRQVLDKGDLRHGLITGGLGTYRPSFDPDSKQVREHFDGDPVHWVSAEHNFDAYFFLRDLYRLTDSPTYRSSAARIRSGLSRLWSPHAGQFFRGIRDAKTLDRFLPLDAASWGALYLMAVGDHEKAKLCLAATDNYRSTVDGTLKGYAPYFKDPVYEQTEVNQYFYPDDANITWNRLPFVWGEGTLGVAAAFARAGDSAKARRIIQDTQGLELDGGIRYASSPIPFQFETFPSVASTAWLVIVQHMLHDPNEIFWGK